MSDMVVGIDLGTTNSEIAAFVNDKVKVLGPEADKMLPSCVGLSPAGALLVGREARHQQLVYPHLTIRSIKRKMGSTEAVKLGDKELPPQEISSLILRQLVEWAQHDLNQPIGKAVITVPAYFSDAQRNATREAGELATTATSPKSSPATETTNSEATILTIFCSRAWSGNSKASMELTSSTATRLRVPSYGGRPRKPRRS